MQLTRLDLNSWLIELANKRLLVDPWLVDPLVFGASWLIALRHAVPPVYTPETLPPVDLVLISQAQPDHCHLPTLARLRQHYAGRPLPIVASPAAARLLRREGYEQVQELKDFASYQDGALTVTAVPGAEVQFVRENGYLLTDSNSGEKLYYEPHQTDEQSLSQVAERSQPDVLLMPVVGLAVPGLGEVVNGPDSALAMARSLRPKVIVPTTLGEVSASGLLASLLSAKGSVEEFESKLTASGLATRFLRPAPGETIEIIPEIA